MNNINPRELPPPEKATSIKERDCECIIKCSSCGAINTVNHEIRCEFESPWRVYELYDDCWYCGDTLIVYWDEVIGPISL